MKQKKPRMAAQAVAGSARHCRAAHRGGQVATGRCAGARRGRLNAAGSNERAGGL